MDDKQSTNQQDRQEVRVELTSSPERSLIHASDSNRYVVFSTHVHHVATAEEEPKRLPLELALVLDRSGSMHGEKLQTAKQAVLAVLDHLTPRDTVSLVAFDSHIKTIQSPAKVTSQLKSQLRERLLTLEASTSTALHQGWLTGCKSLVDTADTGRTLKRCFLLTDGIANVGMTDPEQIASAAASMREENAISTSTFGIGIDYNELLLGPMAVAGGGQFHHLRTPEEIINTFVGELGELLSVAALQVCLEVETSQGTELDLVSPYWLKSDRNNPLRRIISIGDLQSNDERPVVVCCKFPTRQADAEPQVVRARVVWRSNNTEHATDWQEIRFTYASQQACEGEARDPEVMKLVAQHEADRARREAVASSQHGDYQGAQRAVRRAVHSMNRYATSSPIVEMEQSSLNDLADQLMNKPMAPEMSKEIYYGQQRRSRNRRDYRQAPQPPTPSEPDDN